MSKICMTDIMEKCENGIKAVSSAVDTAKSITVSPRLNASLTVKSKNNKDCYCNKSISVDKEYSLLRIICFVLAVIAAFAAASVIVNSLFAMFDKKKKNKSEICSDCSDSDICC